MKLWAAGLLCVVTGCGSFVAPVSRVGIWNLAEQRISGKTSVIVPGDGLHRDVSILVTIGVDGTVLEAKALHDGVYQLNAAPALAVVRAWRFRPQRFDGAPVEAVGSVQVTYATPEVAPTAVPFPAIDLKKAVLTMTRGACFGTCPAYTVSVSGTGLVRFSTEDGTMSRASEVHRHYNGSGVLWPGVHTAQLDPTAAGGLIDRVRQIGFLGLKNEYNCPVTDLSATQLSFAAPGVKKTVVDYVGECVGMPHAVIALEAEVDRVTGTSRYVSGTPETLTLLEKDGFDPRSTAGADLAAALAFRARSSRNPDPATTALVELLLDRGVRLDTTLTRPVQWGGGDSRPGSRIVLGDWLLGRAVAARDAKLFAKLADRGVLARANPSALTEMLQRGAACSPEIAGALIRAGAEPRRALAEGSALTAVRESYGPCEGRSEDEVAAMATALLDLGVPSEARDNLGWTALMGVNSPALARALLAGKADPNARDKDGTTPLLSTDDDRVALILLRAGADPRVQNENGTLRAQALKHHMPATLAWLDEHKVQ